MKNEHNNWEYLEQCIDDKIRNRLCWGAGRSHGSLIFFQIGTPALDIFEIKKSDDGFSRRVHVVGEYSVYIMYCGWKIFDLDNKIVASSDDDISVISKNVRKIDGLNFISIIKSDDGILLNFESGVYIKIRHVEGYDEEDELMYITQRDPKIVIDIFDDKFFIESKY